jgi:hypothetical protein
MSEHSLLRHPETRASWLDLAQWYAEAQLMPMMTVKRGRVEEMFPESFRLRTRT